MTDIIFSNYFGASSDFENLKKWFQINSELYKDVILAIRERSDLELEYSSRLTKINAKILKAFSQSLGSVNVLWCKTAQFMNEEATAHKFFGTQISENVFKPLVHVSEEYDKSKKPIEAEIDKCLKLFMEKRDDECKLKKKAFLSTKESEKSYEYLEDYKTNHPSSVSGFDKERAKIEKRAIQCLEISSKAEDEYIESSFVAEALRHKWEQSYISGLEKLQNIETSRLNSMRSIIESYYQSLSRIPTTYVDIATRLLREIDSVNIREDLFKNCMHFTNKNATVYRTEQLMLDFYAESKDNRMEVNRRRDNLMKHINVLNQSQKKIDNIRAGTLKMLTVYEQTSQFADEATRNRTKREYSKVQCHMNLLIGNLYKVQRSLCLFERKPEPNNPLISIGSKILIVNDRNGFIQSILESQPGTILSYFDPGIINKSSSFCSESVITSEYDDNTDFFDDYDEEPKIPPRSLVTSNSYSSSSSSSTDRVSLQKQLSSLNADIASRTSQLILNTPKKPPRPLPALPATGPSQVSPPQIRCEAQFDYVGRDETEMTFNTGDIIIVTNKLSDVWWEGTCNGRSGLIPTNYVNELV